MNDTRHKASCADLTPVETGLDPVPGPVAMQPSGRVSVALREAEYLAMSGQFVDATIISAPKQRATKAEKRALKEGSSPKDS